MAKFGSGLKPQLVRFEGIIAGKQNLNANDITRVRRGTQLAPDHVEPGAGVHSQLKM